MNRHDPKIARGFVLFSRVVASLMVAAALVSLTGWWMEYPLLTTVLPGRSSMKANVAIGLALSGFALLLSQSSHSTSRRVSEGLSMMVVAIGALTLLEYVLVTDFGIDHLFPDPDALRRGEPAGRMSEIIAVAMLLLGGLGLLVSRQRWLILREGLAIGLLAIAMTGMASFGFIVAGDTNALFERVPINTSIVLLLATLGWMSSVPTTGLTRVAVADTLGGAFARRLLLPALLLPVVFTFFFEVFRSRLGLPITLVFTLVSLLTGGTVAWLVWWVARLLDEVERQSRQSTMLRNHANTDALTGLSNRRALDSALEGLLRGNREDDTTFTLLLLDLDRFKTYNDDFGHQRGDDVLRIVARILHSALRPSDVAARYGGEEFALLLVATDAEQGRIVASRILGDFHAFPWPFRAVTVSIGVAEARPGDGPAELIRRADRALYEAKSAGRDRVVTASDPALPPRSLSMVDDQVPLA